MSRQSAKRCQRGQQMSRNALPMSAARDHGHGGKGGAYARFATRGQGFASTTRTAAACIIVGVTRRLFLSCGRTCADAPHDLFSVRDAYGRDAFRTKIGKSCRANAGRAQWLTD